MFDNDIEEIKKVSEELSTFAQAIGMKMYQAEQAQAQKGAEGNADKNAEGGEKKADESESVEGEVVDGDTK